MTDRRKPIVLLGPGHTHLEIIRRWRAQPINGATLTVVGNFFHSTYSGMLPGTIAGQYRPDAMRIELESLCQQAGVEWIVGETTTVDLSERKLRFSDRAPLPFDLLSIGIGSRPDTSLLATADADTLLPIKPMQTFLQRWESRIEPLATEAGVSGEPVRIAIVGGGAGGVEVALCLQAAMRRDFPELTFHFSIFDRSDAILGDMSSAARRKGERVLRQRGIELELNREVASVEERRLVFSDGGSTPADVAVWITAAIAPELTGRIELPKDDRGFLLVNDRLQSLGDQRIFVVGDTATNPQHPVAKAGVYAVKQAPTLWHNLQAQLRGKRLKKFRPQGDFLRLLNCGDGRAILDYRGFAFHGRWCWWLKDRIDRKFVEQYR